MAISVANIRMSSKVLSTYRGLIRAANLAFEHDLLAKKSAYDRIRSEYRDCGELDQAEKRKRIQFAKDCAHILRTNVVQGVRKEESSDRPVYQLRIHEESELGDNDDRFNPFDEGAGTGCCGGGKQELRRKA